MQGGSLCSLSDCPISKQNIKLILRRNFYEKKVAERTVVCLHRPDSHLKSEQRADITSLISLSQRCNFFERRKMTE